MSTTNTAAERGQQLSKTSVMLPNYVPAEIAAEIRRAVDVLAALGVSADCFQIKLADIYMLYDSAHAYSIWIRGTVDEVARLMIPLAEAGFGWNVYSGGQVFAALIIQFHKPTWRIEYAGQKYRFGRDCAGAWGADRFYGA